MISREGIVQYSDIACEDYTRLCTEEIREMQNQFNVNQCDECDSWFEGETPTDGTVTIIEELEFWERFGDVETI